MSELIVGTLTLASLTTQSLSGVVTFGSGSSAAILQGAGTLLNTGTATAADLGSGTAGILLTGSAVLTTTGSFIDNGVIEFSGTGTIDNAAAGVFDLEGADATIEIGAYGSGTLNNAGLIEKTAGTGTNHVQAYLIETGTVQVTTGTLEFDGSGLLGGKFETSGNGVIAFGGGNAYGAGTYGAIGNSATVGGNVRVANATLSPSAGTSLTLSGADVFGNAGTPAIFNGPGTIGTSGVATAADLGSGTADILLTGASLWRNTGAVGDAGIIDFSGAGQIDNAAQGVFNLNGADSAIKIGAYGSGTVSNEGLFEKTGGSAADHVQAFLINTGTVDVTTGTLEFDGSGVLGGIFETSGDGVIALGGGNAYGAGSYSGYGNSATVGGNVRVANATLSPSAGTSLTLSGVDTFGGAGAASFTGPGTLITTGTATAADLGSSTADILLNGTILWCNEAAVNDAGVIDFNGAGVIDNAAAHSFDLSGADSAIEVGAYGSGTLTNAGLFEKTGSSAANVIQAYLINTGTVDATSGTLALDGGGLLGGTFETSGAGVIALGAGRTFGVHGAAAKIGGSLLVANAALAPTAGTTLNLSGNDTFGNAAGAATLDGAGTLVTSHTLVAADLGAGTADMLLTGSEFWENTGKVSDAGIIYFSGAGSIDNTKSFDLSGADSTIEIGAYGAGSFANAGTLEKSGSTATNHVQAYLINTGTVDATAGTLEFDGGGLLGGSFKTSGSGRIDFGGGNAYGAGSYAVYGSSATIGGDVLVANATLSPAAGTTMILAGTDSFGGAAGAASLNGNGTIITSGAATVTDLGTGAAGALVTGGAVWTNTGTVNDAGIIDFTGTGVIDNSASAVFDLSGTDSAIDVGAYGSGTFLNEGVLELAAGASKDIQATLINIGAIELAGGSFSASALYLAPASTLAGSGMILGTIADAGTIAANGVLDIAGAISGAGELVIGSSATLELGGTASQTAIFNGIGTLQLDVPASYSGTLSGLASGDVIDIASTTVSAATVSGASVLITLSGGTKLAYALSGALTGYRLAIAADGHSGSDITVIKPSAPAFTSMAFLAQDNGPPPDMAPGMRFGKDLVSHTGRQPFNMWASPANLPSIRSIASPAGIAGIEKNFGAGENLGLVGGMLPASAHKDVTPWVPHFG
jgi:hypothetical protein